MYLFAYIGISDTKSETGLCKRFLKSAPKTYIYKKVMREHWAEEDATLPVETKSLELRWLLSVVPNWSVNPVVYNPGAFFFLLSMFIILFFKAYKEGENKEIEKKVNES